MTRRLVIVGGGGFGREALDVVEAMNAAASSPVFDVVGILDDAPSELTLKRLAARGAVHLGTVDAWFASEDDADFAIAVGNPAVRRRLAERFEQHGRRPATLIHPRAGIGSVPDIGDGAIICAGVQISTNVRLGRHVHVNPNATIGHDAILDDYVSVNPGSNVSGGCLIEQGTLIGAGAVILQGLTIGQRAVVAAAACVIRDVPEDAVVKGVPAT